MYKTRIQRGIFVVLCVAMLIPTYRYAAMGRWEPGPGVSAGVRGPYHYPDGRQDGQYVLEYFVRNFGENAVTLRGGDAMQGVIEWHPAEQPDTYQKTYSIAYMSTEPEVILQPGGTYRVLIDAEELPAGEYKSTFTVTVNGRYSRHIHRFRIDR